MPDLKAIYTNLAKNLHYLYLLFAVPLVLIALIDIPPFQNPDEPNHFARAEQVSRLEWAPTFENNIGFKVDKGVYQTADVYAPIAHHIGIKATAADKDSVKNIGWRKGFILRNFANTAIYAPVGYVMPALGIGIGKIINLSVINTFYLARLLNALLSITLCFFALRLAKRSKILLFTVLLFPMTVALFASVSQDAVLISCAFLLVGLIDFTESTLGKNYTKRELILMIVLVSIICIAKPPYLPFVLVFPFLKLGKKEKIVSIILPVILVIGWFLLAAANLTIKMPEMQLTVNPQVQLSHVLHNPLRFAGLFFKMDMARMVNTFLMFVGILGWLDTPMPFSYYNMAYLITIIVVCITLNLTVRDKLKLRLGLFITALVALMAVLTSQYINFTAVDATIFGGVQGRYLIPIFPFLALSLPLSKHEDVATNFKAIGLILVLLFPLFTVVNLVHILNIRYW